MAFDKLDTRGYGHGYSVGEASYRMPIRSLGGILQGYDQPVYRIYISDEEAIQLRNYTQPGESAVRHDGEDYFILVIGMRGEKPQ